jgi:hypothetical protein
MQLKTSLNKYLIYLLVIIVFIGLTPLVVYFWKFHHGFASNHTAWGEFGSLFGGVLGPVAALLALAGLLRSIDITREQFTIVQKESSFFQLINLHVQKIESIVPDKFHSGYNSFLFFKKECDKIAQEQLVSLGRFSFINEDEIMQMSHKSAAFLGPYLSKSKRKLFDKNQVVFIDDKSLSTIKTFLLSQSKSDRDEALKIILGWPFPPDIAKELSQIGFSIFYDYPIEKKLEIIEVIYEGFYGEFRQYFNHYFKNVHYTLKYISSCRNVEHYKNIFAAQLSQYELEALFLHYCSFYSGIEFVELIYKMHILEGMNTTNLFFGPKASLIAEMIEYRYDKRQSLYSGFQESTDSHLHLF